MAIKGIKMLPPSVSDRQAKDIYASLANVKQKIGKLTAEIKYSLVSENLVNLLSLQESVESTRIEGTQVTFSNAIENIDSAKKSTEQREVENYQRALLRGSELVRNGYPIATRLLQELHEILMNGSRGTSSGAGKFRKIQNFIGPTNKIEDAVYIPIGANEISSYMENLEHYINSQSHRSFVKHSGEGEIFDETVDPLIKTAIMHAQFESIHPFLDGNGRLGRIMIVLNMLNDKLIEYPVFFVSEELEKEKARYYDLLNGVRGDNPDWYSWIKFFIDSCDRMADNLLKKLNLAQDLALNGNKNLKTPSLKQVWLATFRIPVATVAQIKEITGLSAATVRKNLEILVDEGLLYVSKQEKRNKKYRNYSLMRILEG
ncbi:Fic family protein [Streptococcaceae bacterium ESL0687]|nr:Fic family protein [Streptococcaceae bacterium ESL0687]